MYNTEPINGNEDIIKNNQIINQSSVIENELKELKRRKFKLDIEIEKKIEIFNELMEENKNLQLMNKNFRVKLKGINSKKSNTCTIISNSVPNIISNTKQKRNSKDRERDHLLVTEKTNSILGDNSKHIITNFNPENLDIPPEILRTKEEYAEIQLLLKTKKKYFSELKKKIKSNNTQITDLIKVIKEITDNKYILFEELLKLEEEFKINTIKTVDPGKTDNFKTIGGNSSKNLSSLSQKEVVEFLYVNDKSLKEKLHLDECILNLRNDIQIKEKEINEMMDTFNLVVKEIERNQLTFAILMKEKCEIQKKKRNCYKILEKYENFIKSTELQLSSMKSNLRKNKSEREKLEEDLNCQIYFIRFSNSFVRAFFNLITTRRLQIEMIYNLEKQEKQLYDFMYKKLDDLEISLLREYKEFLLLCEENKEDISILY